MVTGTRLGPYEILEPIGRGGMGEVYRAYDTRLRRKVAIKTVASALLADPAMRVRFDREARAIAALSHPNILAIYDVGDRDGIPFIAVELLEGDTLRSRIGSSPLPLATALDYAIQIGRGLAAAHDRGIIHRDLKPDGILATNRRALADGADWPMVFMQNAAVHALQGQAAAALDELERGYAAGWRDGRTLAIDPFFARIRTESRFTQLLSRMQSDVAAMRARADCSGLP